jgi:hypothetical protein
METPGMTTAITGVCLILATCCCYATGGDSYEHTVKLSETLDILPGKSLGEIFLETSTIHPPTDSWDPAKLRELAARIGTSPAAIHAISRMTSATQSLFLPKIRARHANTSWHGWTRICRLTRSTGVRNRPPGRSKQIGFTGRGRIDLPEATGKIARRGSIAW